MRLFWLLPVAQNQCSCVKFTTHVVVVAVVPVVVVVVILVVAIVVTAVIVAMVGVFLSCFMFTSLRLPSYHPISLSACHDALCVYPLVCKYSALLLAVRVFPPTLTD